MSKVKTLSVHEQLIATCGVNLLQPEEKVETVKELLQQGASPFYQKEGLLSAMMLAAKRNQADLLSLFCEHGFNPSQADSTGHLPLTIACSHQSWDAALVLLKAGADPEQRGDAPLSPMQRVLKMKNAKAITLLQSFKK